MHEYLVHVASVPLGFPLEGVSYVHTYRLMANSPEAAVTTIEQNWHLLSTAKIDRIWAESVEHAMLLHTLGL